MFYISVKTALIARARGRTKAVLDSRSNLILNMSNPNAPVYVSGKLIVALILTIPLTSAVEMFGTTVGTLWSLASESRVSQVSGIAPEECHSLNLGVTEVPCGI